MSFEYTNKADLPETVCHALAKDYYTDSNEKPSDYSASTLIKPTQMVELSRRYRGTAKIPKRDILDNLKSWTGSVLHEALEKAFKEGMDGVVEKRFYTEILGKTISGKVDCLLDDTIYDYKTTACYKIQKAVKDPDATLDWVRQQNIYAYLAGLDGYEINSLVIIAIMLDHKRHESYKKDYPTLPIQEIELDLWTKEEQLDFICERVALLEKAKDLSDEELAEQIPCSRYDQWSSYKDTALIKEGANRATKVFSSMEEGEIYVEENEKFQTDEFKLVDRYTKKTRCLDYCDVRNCCSQFRNEQGVDL